MASAVPAELSQAKYHLPINGSHNPTPLKQPSQKDQDTVTQVPRSPSISQRPLPDQVSQKDSDSTVHDSLDYRPPAPAGPPRPLLDFLEQSVPIETRQPEGASHEKQLITSGASAQLPVIAQSSLEVPLREHSSFEDHVVEENSIQLPPLQEHSLLKKNATPEDPGKAHITTSSEKHTVTATQTQPHRSVHVEIEDDSDEEEIQDCITVRSQPTAPPTKSEVFKASVTPTEVLSISRSATTGINTPSMPPKGSTTKATASQSRKSAGTTSKRSSKPAPRLPDIVNQGETSAVAILQQRKAGGTSQSNTTKQTSARPSQAPTNKSSIKPTTKSTQQRQTQSQNVPTKQPSHKTKPPVEHGEFDLSPDPDVEPFVARQRDRTKQAKATETAAPSKKSITSRSKKQAAKVSDTDGDDDDEDYNAPKLQKSRGATTTRASTRAQTKKANKKPALTDREKDEIDDFEDSVTHINSGGASESRLATQAQPAKPPALEEAKPRRRTEKETQLMMEALTSPDHATISTATRSKINKEAPATQTHSSSAYEPMPEQGTTQRNPVNINDDISNDDDEDAMTEAYDASFNQTVTESMSQKPQEELKTLLIADRTSESQSTDAHTSLVQQLPARLSGGHSDLDLLAQERAQRKPNLVSFNDAGPRNQGTRNMKKRLSPDIHRLPFPEAPSPDLDHSHLEAPPDDFDTSLDMPTKNTSNSEIAGISTHVEATSPTYKRPGDVFRSKAKPLVDQPLEVVSIIDVSIGTEKRSKGPELSTKAFSVDSRQTSTRFTTNAAGNRPLVVSRAAVKRGAQAELPENLVEDSPRHEVLRKGSITINPLVSLGKSKVSIESDGPRDPAVVSSRPSGPDNHTLALPTPIETQAPPRNIQPRPVHRSSETKNGKSLMLSALETRESASELQPKESQTKPLKANRKRPFVEINGEPAKRPRTGPHNSHTQVARSPAAKSAVSRRLSQVADNGSPIPYGIEIPQQTVQSPRMKDERMSAVSVPPRFLAHQPMDDPFTQVKKVIHKEAARSESPLEEMDALQQGLPAQTSPAVTHAGFDEDTQVTAENLQTSEPQKQPPKDTVSGPQQNLPQKVQATQRTLSLMEALRSEIPQETAQEADGDDMKSTGHDEGRDEEDADKTLVNEETDDGDDDDSNDSESSSDSDDEGDKPKSGLSMWRHALKSHQRNVYDHLVRIAHRLTEQLKDHETAIEDISTDYKQDGARLIERFEKENEARLEQYCIKRLKMQGGLVLGYEKVSGSIHKDKKDINASRDRHIKILQRQVDAEGKLEQLLQTYHL